MLLQFPTVESASLLSAFLVLLAAIGVSGMTWLFPALARLLRRFPIIPAAKPYSIRAMPPEQKLVSNISAAPISFVVLIPVHNDASQLEQTLASIEQSVETVALRFRDVQVRVAVGLDACVDNSLDVARRAGATVIISDRHLGKWSMLERLFRDVEPATWTILSDCGAAWPADFFEKIVPDCLLEDTVGIAPTYREKAGGSFLWKLEAALKRLENSSGGPVSVHGSTVVYRTACLGRTFDWLKRITCQSSTESAISWINDDVVIPLALRALHPNGTLLYQPEVVVTDSGVSKIGSDGNRRRRILTGNVQWLRKLLPHIFRLSPVVGILALRRVFRVLWAYWCLLCVLAAGGLFSFAGIPEWFVVLGILALLIYGGVRTGLLGAARASFAAPLLLARPRGVLGSREVVWR